MRKYLALALLLILFLLCSCAAKKTYRNVNLPMTVQEIKGDTAILKTRHFNIPYFADAKGREVGEEKYFFGIATPAEIPGEYYFKINQAIPLNDTTRIRRSIKINRYLKLN